jgi:hypothetical protein
MLSPNYGLKKTTNYVRVTLHGLGGIGYVIADNKCIVVYQTQENPNCDQLRILGI